MIESEALYVKQINPYNAMGHKGELANAFALVIKEMWTNRFAVLPKSFKSIVGRLHD